MALGEFFDQDEKIFRVVNSDLRENPFWRKYGKDITYLGNDLTQGALSAIFYVAGSEKDREVSQMLMESALSLRVVY